MELVDRMFYQASCDVTKVAIIVDYPGLLPALHVSNQETCPLREFPLSTLPTSLYYALKGRRSTRHATPEATRKKVAPTPGRPSMRKANRGTAEPSSKMHDFFLNMLLGCHIEV